MQLKKLMIEVMVFFVLGCFLCACGKTKDQTRKTTKDANKEIMIGGDNYAEPSGDRSERQQQDQ